MNVKVFRAFPDVYRLSMGWYADAIVRRVGRQMTAGESIAAEAFPDPRVDGGWRRYWDQYVRYARYARSHAGDVNHIADHAFSHLISSLPAGRSVVTFHDAVALRVPGISWRTQQASRYQLKQMRRAAAVICPSEASRADLLDLADLKPERIHVIPHGLDESFRPPKDREQVRRALGFSGDVVLMVGHTQHYMNTDRMLRVFGTLIARHGSQATLVKVGLPFSPDQTRLISELELGDRVRFAGRVPAADLPSYFQAADVLFYAPLLAGFGLPPLEAMACGTPVVCSNRGAIPEVVGTAALSADAEDEPALAAALAEVLGSAVKRRRMIDAGFERAGHFPWSLAARRTLDVYRSVGQR